MTAFSPEIYEAIEKEAQMDIKNKVVVNSYDPKEDYTKSGHEEGEIRIAKEIASAHTSWFGNMVLPLMENYMVHGFKHGVEFEKARRKKGGLQANPSLESLINLYESNSISEQFIIEALKKWRDYWRKIEEDDNLYPPITKKASQQRIRYSRAIKALCGKKK